MECLIVEIESQALQLSKLRHPKHALKVINQKLNKSYTSLLMLLNQAKH